MSGNAQFRGMVWQIAEDYACANLLLRLPGHCPMPARALHAPHCESIEQQLMLQLMTPARLVPCLPSQPLNEPCDGESLPLIRKSWEYCCYHAKLMKNSWPWCQ